MSAADGSTIGAWSGPASSIPDLQDVATDVEDEDEPGETYLEVIDYPDPITHGVGVNFVANDAPDDARVDDDLDTVYRRLWHAWRTIVEEPGNEPWVVVEDAHELLDFANDDFPADLVLRSKRWMVGTEANGEQITAGQRYEYSLQLTRRDPKTGELKPNKPLPVNFQVWIRPQERGLVYKSGDELDLPFGAGTTFHTQTTYAEPLEAVNRTLQVVTIALDELGEELPEWSTIRRESMKVWKAEVHHRIAKELMSAACETLAEAKRLIDYGGGADMEQHSKRQEAGRVRELVRADRWDLLGFVQPDGLDLAVKVYRSSNWQAYHDETYKNPKVEAYLAGTHNDQALPHVREWPALRAVLRQLATGISVRSGVTIADLVEDDYYSAWEREHVDVPIPMGWRTKLQEANDERERQIYRTTMSSLSRARWDVLWTIAQYEGATYEQLQDVTGLSYDYVREIVRELERAEVLTRLTWPRVIVYHNEELRVNAIELLQDVHPDEGIVTIKERATDRRERRERDRREREADEAAQSAARDGASSDEGSGSPPGDAGQDDASSASTATQSADRFALGEWYGLDELDVLSPEELRNALERDYLDDEHVAIRTDPYDWLG